MVSFRTFVANFVLLLAGIQTASAADCDGDNPSSQCWGSYASASSAWSARAAYCGGNKWQDTSIFHSNGICIKFSQPGANGQQTCWDALENIIDQCRTGSSCIRGKYSWAGTYYTMSFCDSTTCDY